MKFYLSSYKFGEESKRLKELVPTGNNKVGYIPNALDFSGADPVRREEGIRKEMEELERLGLQPELVDLRDYFGKEDERDRKIEGLGGVFIRGGNTYILRQAMKLSGLDNLVQKMYRNGTNFLYSGYSAGVCVLAPSLEALKIVDDPKDLPYKSYGQNDVIWEGLGILDYMILPHYQSDHPESKLIDEEVEYYKKHNLPFKPLRDGEVIIIE
jgi:dipeptidase E